MHPQGLVRVVNERQRLRRLPTLSGFVHISESEAKRADFPIGTHGCFVFSFACSEVNGTLVYSLLIDVAGIPSSVSVGVDYCTYSEAFRW